MHSSRAAYLVGGLTQNNKEIVRKYYSDVNYHAYRASAWLIQHYSSSGQWLGLWPAFGP